MSTINKALAIIAGLAFFLPFITISCNKQVLVEVTGAKLVQCSISTCSPKDVFSPKLKSMVNIPGVNIPDTDVPTPGAKNSHEMDDVKLVLFAAIAVLVAAIGLFVAGRGGELLSGVASVAAIVCLFIFRSKFSDALGPQLNSPEMKSAGLMLQIQLQFASGFWLSVVASACSAILAFKGTSAARSLVSSPGGGTGFASQPPAGASSGGGASFCTACGASNTSGKSFCLSCGASLVPAPPASPPVEATAVKTTTTEAQPSVAPASSSSAAQGNSCPSCGAGNPEGNKFCLSCGGSLMPTVQLFQPQETIASPPPSAIATAAPTADHQGGDMGWLNAPATMAAAAAASPAAQPLPATAPAREPEPSAAAAAAPAREPEPPAVAITAPAPQVIEPQASLDLQPPEPEPTPAADSPKPAEQACSSCGAAITTGQKFCLSCGAPVGQTTKSGDTSARTVVETTAPTPPEPEPRLCSTCSAALTEGQKFCLACGTPVSQPATTSQPAAAVYSAPVPQYRPTAEPQIFEAPPPKSSAKTVIIVVVLLAAAGGGGWYAWQYFSRPDVTVSAFPQRTHVAIGGKTALQASVSGSKDTDVDWTIQEGNKGGQLNVLGSGIVSGQPASTAIYNAPQTNGTFHVIATSHANPGRSAKIEVVVGGLQQPDTSTAAPESPATPVPPPSTAASPMAAQIVGTWRGPSAGMQTVIGADSTIAMNSETDAGKNLSGTYHFTDNSHLQIDFGNGDIRKWEIVGVDNNYLRVTSQSKDGSSAIIFAKVQ